MFTKYVKQSNSTKKKKKIKKSCSVNWKVDIVLAFYFCLPSKTHFHFQFYSKVALWLNCFWFRFQSQLKGKDWNWRKSIGKFCGALIARFGAKKNFGTWSSCIVILLLGTLAVKSDARNGEISAEGEKTPILKEKRLCLKTFSLLCWPCFVDGLFKKAMENGVKGFQSKIHQETFEKWETQGKKRRKVFAS